MHSSNAHIRLDSDWITKKHFHIVIYMNVFVNVNLHMYMIYQFIIYYHII